MIEATRWSKAEIYDLDIKELMFWLKEIKSLNDDRASLRKDK
jgi:hypothetical protein